jgi:putative membrane protein
MWNHGSWGMGSGMGLMLLFWTLVIITIVWAVKAVISGKESSKTDSDRSAVDILRERYAQGEIDQEEYRQKLNDLNRSN